MAAIQLTIVVPAYNSTTTIKECIGSIHAQIMDMEGAQIIVVDNGKNANIEHLLRGFNISLLKRYAHQSAAYARNEGCNSVRSGILVFIDSDVIIEADCLKNLIAPILSKACHATIGNYSTEVEQLTFAQRYKQLYVHNVYRRRPTQIKNDFWTAIAAIDAGVFHSLGGFDTQYAGASGEDQELGIRLSKHHYKIQKVNEALALHKHDYDILKIIKNDIKKGLTVMGNTFENQVPLTDHGHASHRDISAVFFACLGLLCFCLVFIVHKQLLALAGLVSISGWAFSKADLIQLFIGSQGWGFALLSLPLMYFLDLIRAYCVVVGLAKKSVHSKWRPKKTLSRFPFKQEQLVQKNSTKKSIGTVQE